MKDLWLLRQLAQTFQQRSTIKESALAFFRARKSIQKPYRGYAQRGTYLRCLISRFQREEGALPDGRASDRAANTEDR